MASKISPLLLQNFGRSSLRPSPALRIARAAFSTEAPPPPPLLSKLKDDLKAAMRVKDTNRLAVLRSVLAATVNASKADKPISTDSQLVGVIRKLARQSQEAANEARQAGREDLVEKEEAQQQILEAYASASGLREIGEAELKQLIESAKAKLLADGVKEKSIPGLIVKQFLAPGGTLDGATFDSKKVVSSIMETCGSR
ncbi:uncharacterized protein C8A04DRAFT_35424 [Dichotomopilus funicola]|uniref:Altered inheritance of mitochondria protein 41 n=1 Tax=Dichotomopilus funicola TaxID=1934379 RepID=A0AAN6V956_9PEZI|nr:hypothetical protein C8A04DRAFT_35424 [Dichotomopilus funicola]